MVCAHVQMRNRCSFYSGRSPLKKAQVSQGRFIPEHRHLSARSARGIRKDSLDYHDLASWGICPAGMHQEAPDENLGTRNMCTPCTDGKDYTEYQNSLRSCLSCTRCKEGQEEVSRCSPTRNTKCRCKAGTFCPPDQPCEVCVRCKTDCPEGEELISSCNATADNLCMRPTGPPATQGYVGWVVLIVIILFSICIVIVAYCLWKKRSQDSTGGSSSSTSKAGVSLVRKVLKYSFTSSNQEVRENELNSRNDPAAEPILPPEESTPSRPRSTPTVFPTLIPVDQTEQESGHPPYTVGEGTRLEDPSAAIANMTPDEHHAFHKRGDKYRHILDVNARYLKKKATGAWRAFAHERPPQQPPKSRQH
ncbi:tumor necrosis factor receptor superfamily member 10D-like isoform X3 [Pleurodeles waltl]|uniref:tumor necrosis factor receptor superfamily member 10D-like isoform X3 n=1 Tax=Pleurodeles waltl TaxID=8319 RepID=UPI003709381C